MQIDIENNSELRDVIRLFFGDELPSVSMSCDGLEYAVTACGKSHVADYGGLDVSTMPENRKFGRLAKIALYDALSSITGRETPWGALTGVRPTKLFYEALSAGKSIADAENTMRELYGISPSRAHILKEIVTAQSGKRTFPPQYVNLYVHIPYCLTRCSYCSFVSFPIDKKSSRTDEYVDLLCDEIRSSTKLLDECGRKILTVYIGGGTPTALSAKQLDKVLASIELENSNVEFTCEAGRPDTIDEEKLDVMKTRNVTRVCINPQTLNDATLEAIGRRHTSEDFYGVYERAHDMGFIINCDLIAGLTNETVRDFIKSFDGVKALKPHNITVHSLSKKNGSAIRYTDGENENAASMVEYALNSSDDYVPYYLYRQKRQAGNLENVGFALPGYECVNNITVMEETVGVMACGAGAISKVVGNGEIKRFANMRDIGLYIERYEEKTKEKLKFFEDFFSK